jgi:energy-coupling factor transporter ATP-binding protein EcfA2
VLALYARLRGVPEPAVPSAVRPLLARLGLAPLAGRPAGGYSGGNRRRLSVGVALVGAPAVVLLDEPSTGMVGGGEEAGGWGGGRRRMPMQGCGAPARGRCGARLQPRFVCARPGPAPRTPAPRHPARPQDPAARRALWDIILDEVRRGGPTTSDGARAPTSDGAGAAGAPPRRTVVLTSHSMEECEALCGRVAIMAGGRLACLGAVQRLKARFGDGYTLEARLAAPRATEGCPPADAGSGGGGSGGAAAAAAGEGAATAAGAGGKSPAAGAADAGEQAAAAAAEFGARAAELLAAVRAAWPAAALVESDAASRQLLIRLPQPQGGATAGGGPGAAPLAEVFEAVEGAREALGVSDYSLCQSSLERVFLRLARGGGGSSGA